MRSITITPAQEPIANEATPCVLTVINNDNTSSSFSIEIPANMMTLVSNPPELSAYITSDKVQSVITDLTNTITDKLVTLSKKISDIPKPANTSNFVTNDKLEAETQARDTDIGAVKEAIEGLQKSISDTSDDVTTTKKSIDEESTRAKDAEEHLSETITDILAIKDTSVSGSATDSDSKAVIGLDVNKSGLAVAHLDKDNSIVLASNEDLLNLSSTFTKALSQDISDLTDSVNARIDKLTNAILTGNINLTNAFNSLSENGNVITPKDK